MSYPIFRFVQRMEKNVIFARFSYFKVLCEKIIMGGNKYLHPVFLEVEQHIHNSWYVFRIDICFRFVPEQN